MSRKIKNILVTGAGGFIGGHLVNRLIENGKKCQLVKKVEEILFRLRERVIVIENWI